MPSGCGRWAAGASRAFLGAAALGLVGAGLAARLVSAEKAQQAAFVSHMPPCFSPCWAFRASIFFSSSFSPSIFPPSLFSPLALFPPSFSPLSLFPPRFSPWCWALGASKGDCFSPASSSPCASLNLLGEETRPKVHSSSFCLRRKKK